MKPKFSSIRGLILDMDGVLWRGEKAIGDLPAIFGLLNSSGLRVILASNNATKRPAEFIDKMHSFGVELEPWQAITSAEVSAWYLDRLHPLGGKVYCVGEDGLISTLSIHGFEQSEKDDVLAVVVGLDRTVTYSKLRHATLLIRAGVQFIGTNPDKTLPVPEGQVPGAGSILAALEAATGVSPVIIGKPEPIIFEACFQALGTSPSQTLVVGDRLETDIAGGQSAGCLTALVLTGVTTPDMAIAWKPAPDWIGPDLATLVSDLLER